MQGASRNVWRGLALFLPMGCAASLSAAQTAAPSEGVPATPQTLAPVQVTGNSSADDRRESTVAKAVVTRDDIARFGDATVADVLKRVPGITVGGGGGRATEIRMRGLGSGYTQILINGEPAPAGFSIDSISPGLIERIEVSRVATADTSAQAIAGTINIVLKQTVRSGQREVKASVAGYAGHPAVSLDGQMSDKSGNMSYTLAGSAGREKNLWPSYIQQDAYDATGTPTTSRATAKREFTTEDSLSVSPRVNWKLGATDVITLDGLLRLRHIDGGTLDDRATAFGTLPQYSSDDLRLKLDSTVFRSRLNWAHNFDADTRLDAKIGVNHNRRNSTAVFLGKDETGTLVMDEHVDSSAVDEGLTTSGKLRTAMGESHALAAGWDAEISRRTEDRIQRQSSPTGRPTLDLDEDYDARVTRLAAFIQDEWDIDKSLSAYAGLRWEGLETRSMGNVLAEVRNRSSVFSPVLQAVWRLPGTKGDQVRGGLSRTYKAPVTRDLMPRRYVANDNTPTTPDLQGNPDLRPELAWGLDAAYEHYFEHDAGMVSASVAVRRIQDVLLDELSFTGGAWVSRKVNNGNATVQTFELEGKVKARKLWPSAPDVDLRASMARNWSHVSSVPGPDNRLDRQLPFSANLGADYRVPDAPLTVGGNFSFEGSKQVRTSTTQTVSSGAKRTLDLYGLWKINPSTQLRGTLTNVLHQDFVAGATYADSTGSFVQTTTSPSYVTWRLTLEMKL